MTNVELTDKEINPESGNIEVSLEIDLVQGTQKVINNYTGKPIDNRSFVQGYKGLNKWRTTSEVQTEKNDHSLCFNCKFKRFKHLVAIDTNIGRYQSKVANKELWIGLGVAIAYIENDDGESRVEPFNVPFITSICPEKPENENWIRVIELMRQNCKCDDPRKIGIIVDSDLGNIPAFNKREKPILGKYFLPEEFELIFASDKVTDNIYNRMIKLSHKISYEFIPNLVDNFIKSEEKVLREHNAKTKER